jgi:hemerythrin-like domain-containing protein
MFEQHGLLQFFQHAHHRVEGWLMDFQDSLSQGEVRAEFFDRAAEDLRQHVFVEEELIFPLVEEQLAAPVADLEEEHGWICELVDQIHTMLRQEAEQAGTGTLLARLMSLLAAHTAAEDLGIYPDLLALLGSDKAWTLLAEAEKAEAPARWICAARRVNR